jgi:hypothetical protein
VIYVLRVAVNPPEVNVDIFKIQKDVGWACTGDMVSNPAEIVENFVKFSSSPMYQFATATRHHVSKQI